MKRKWLKVLILLMMAGASFGNPTNPMNPKEIEELMSIMNQTRIEFILPDEDDTGDGGKTSAYRAAMNHLLELWNERR